MKIRSTFTIISECELTETGRDVEIKLLGMSVNCNLEGHKESRYSQEDVYKIAALATSGEWQKYTNEVAERDVGHVQHVVPEDSGAKA